MPAPPARKPAGVASYAEKSVPSAEVSVSPPCAATSPRTGGAGALLSSSWHMIDSLRPAPVDTLSPGADDGPTGRGGSAGRRDREAVDLLPARRPGRAGPLGRSPAPLGRSPAPLARHRLGRPGRDRPPADLALPHQPAGLGLVP